MHCDRGDYFECRYEKLAVGFVVLEVLGKSAPPFMPPVALQFPPKGRIMTITAALNELRG